MNNLLKLFGVLVMSFVFIGCSGSGGSGGGGGGGGGGGTISGEANLRLSGQVWTADWTYDNVYDMTTDVRYTRFNGNRTIFSDIGVNGAINSGQLNFVIDTPRSPYLEYAGDYFGWEYDYNNLIISNPDARVAFLWLEVPGGGIYRELETFSRSGNRVNYTGFYVEFIYVEQNFTISGRGTTNNWENTWDGITYRGTWRTTNFNISLRRGWNTILYSVEGTATMSNNIMTGNSTETISIGNPDNLRWILSEWDDDEWGGNSSAELRSARTESSRQNRRSSLRERIRAELKN